MTKSKLRWISARKAVRRVDKKLGDGIHGSSLVASAIAGGHVSVRGFVVDVPYGGLDIFVETKAKRRPRGDPVSFSRNAKSPKLADIDASATMWTLDKGVIVRKSEHGQPIALLVGVKLRERDLATFLSKRLFWNPLGRDGRPREDIIWRDVLIAILALERHDRLNDANFTSFEALLGEIQEMIDSALGREVLRDDIDLIYELFVRRNEGSPIIDDHPPTKSFNLYELVPGLRARVNFLRQK